MKKKSVYKPDNSPIKVIITNIENDPDVTQALTKFEVKCYFKPEFAQSLNAYKEGEDTLEETTYIADHVKNAMIAHFENKDDDDPTTHAFKLMKSAYEKADEVMTSLNTGYIIKQDDTKDLLRYKDLRNIKDARIYYDHLSSAFLNIYLNRSFRYDNGEENAKYCRRLVRELFSELNEEV